MVAVYGIWQHTNSLKQNKAWIFPLGYIAIFALSLLWQSLRIIYRNTGPGKQRTKLVMHSHPGRVACLTVLVPRPWAVSSGERVTLTIPGLGLFYLFQSHPFAISWWEDGDTGKAVSISLLLRPRSGFTKRIFDRLESGRVYTAWIDGPFGPSTVGACAFSSRLGDYGHIFMVATGIGIAAQLPYVKELLNRHRQARVRTQRISLVWQLDQQDDWESARDWLQALVKQDAGYLLRVKVYDAQQSASTVDPQLFGSHELIETHGGVANWEEELRIEVDQQKGQMLVTEEATGCPIKPSAVRLKATEELNYIWKIDDPAIKPLFDKHLSKHSTGAYIQLCQEVGNSFHALSCDSLQSQLSKESLADQLDQAVGEKTELEARLETVEKHLITLQQSKIELEGEVRNQKSINQMAVQETQHWMSMAEYYHYESLRYSEALEQILSFAQSVRSDLKTVS
ncbi:NADPH oxidase family protein [Aspergillus melleus]|uniref:NADPH oxidase family protein n=1 Tax=Aspergillus melleus TaxID=138277 RepID=UPI001E8CA36F|nr:uncharacterized protein LDX57_009109 [Aspergillus melleus]KAH8431447.1 hypothetical protein LDX57_009109 [Aspergillus melleus]